MMAEPRRVPFISLSPVRRREGESPVLERETGGGREAEQPLAREGLKLPDQEHHHHPYENSPVEPPSQPFESCPRPESHPVSLPREISRPELTPKPPQPPPHRESPRPEAPPLSSHQQLNQENNRQESPPPLDQTVRFELILKDPTEESCVEFSYPELLWSGKARKKSLIEDPFDNEEHERHEVEMLAKKFETKYGGKIHKHRKDRAQDLIDMGSGYDVNDPFIDNSEAYDELVPASLTTIYGGFYINTGILQFRQASDSEEEDFTGSRKHKPSKFSKIKDGDDRSMKKRKRKEEEAEKEKKPRKIKVTKQLGVIALNSHKSEKKKKKLYKDSFSLAAMIRKFQKEKEAFKKKEVNLNPTVAATCSTPSKLPLAHSTGGNDMSDLNLSITDPVLSIFGSTNERELLQEAESALEMLGDIDFDRLLDGTSDGSPVSEPLGENGSVTQPPHTAEVLTLKQVPALPEGLPGNLEKRIEDLRTAAKLFDEEGRKKFFTQDMNNILLDIEMQLQELNPTFRSGVYSHLEAFVPCNRDTLIKRLKKLHLNVQDDRLKEPLQKLKLAISCVMPEQLFKYQEDCQAHSQAKNAKMQAEDERDKNGSEEDDDEKPGKRIAGPRKKFHWDETVRALLCNLVKIKLDCYELEPNKSQSAEDYLKTFMETEVKSLWPKGWMQARMLFKESRSVHNHLTSAPAKKKVILAPKPKGKDSSPKKEQRACPPFTSACVPASSTSTPINAVTSFIPAPETICLDDSLDEDLSFNPPSLDSVSDALAAINNGVKSSSFVSPVDTSASRPRAGLREEKLASIMSKLPLSSSKKIETVQTQHSSSLIAGHTGPVPKKSQDLLQTGISSGLIAGSSIQNPKVSLEPLPAKLLQQGLQRSSQIQAASSQTHVSSSCKGQATASPTSQRPKDTVMLVTSSEVQSCGPSTVQVAKVHQQPTAQQKYVSPLQVTISKSQTNPVVKLSSNPKLSCSSPVTKTSDKPVVYRLPLSNATSGSSQMVHPLVSRTTSCTSTSSNYLAKAMVSHVSAQGFKPPFSMVPSPKPAISPKPSAPKPSVTSKPTVSLKLPSSKSTSTIKPISSSSSSSPSTLVSQNSHSNNNSLHKQSSGVSVNRQSSTLNLLSSNRTSGFQPAKNPQAPSKLSSSSASATAGKNNLSGVGLNVPINRGSSLNASGASRTNPSGAAGSGAQGATKQLSTPHRPSSASGSTVIPASVQSTTGASLLANASPLTLMASPLSVTSQNVTSTPLTPFGMLGSLVPVTMPFQFPLELLSFGTDTAGVTASSGSTSAAFHHSITQNLLKGLQSGAQHSAALSHTSLPAHLQQAYSDGQSKVDAKLQRKTQ
ncbi:ubinuclein-2 isoform X2 [Ahaetulla prasina]|uniref:ubinuclein-2 isoform X1 n=1 Tax=Ahaetulla prasina TaxID=499056 RepID=UPI00264912A8|nr:ubinuclein-2 isoform X1 [Ahaetulla prasina]XP_058045699.1 ubinuclein-2 isoform X2 [Ahaetulla prasina]